MIDRHIRSHPIKDCPADSQNSSENVVAPCISERLNFDLNREHSFFRDVREKGRENFGPIANQKSILAGRATFREWI